MAIARETQLRAFSPRDSMVWCACVWNADGGGWLCWAGGSQRRWADGGRAVLSCVGGRHMRGLLNGWGDVGRAVGRMSDQFQRGSQQ